MSYAKYIDNLRRIDNFCQSYNIKKYSINKDGSIDVSGDVTIAGSRNRFHRPDLFDNKNLTRLPIKFNVVNGNFDASNNELVTLENFPRIIIGELNVESNKLESLDGSVRSVVKLRASNNRLRTLINCPSILESLDVDNNCLTNFIGCPPNIRVNAYYNRIRSLSGLKTSDYRLDSSYLPNALRAKRHIMDDIIKWQDQYSIWKSNDELNPYRFNDMIDDIEEERGLKGNFLYNASSIINSALL